VKSSLKILGCTESILVLNHKIQRGEKQKSNLDLKSNLKIGKVVTGAEVTVKHLSE
jgi:hypothetical protein